MNIVHCHLSTEAGLVMPIAFVPSGVQDCTKPKSHQSNQNQFISVWFAILLWATEVSIVRIVKKPP